jgi:hypothetical protein
MEQYGKKEEDVAAMSRKHGQRCQGNDYLAVLGTGHHAHGAEVCNLGDGPRRHVDHAPVLLDITSCLVTFCDPHLYHPDTFSPHPAQAWSATHTITSSAISVLSLSQRTPTTGRFMRNSENSAYLIAASSEVGKWICHQGRNARTYVHEAHDVAPRVDQHRLAVKSPTLLDGDVVPGVSTYHSHCTSPSSAACRRHQHDAEDARQSG